MSVIHVHHVRPHAHRLLLARMRNRLALARYCYNLVLGTMAAAEEERQEEVLRRRRRWWVRPWLMRRPLYGQYETLMVELMREHHGDFTTFLRMEPQMFHELLQRVGPRIEKHTE